MSYVKVFISWSKPLSHSIAEAFAEWLPKVIQECRGPYVSSDTDKGESWFQAITTELRQSKVGVVFITPQNVNEEWIHLEAGAIYAALDKKLCPVLVNLKKTDYDGPLRNIQMTELGDKADMLKLLRTLNKNCDTPLDDPVLEASFETWWPTLEIAVSEAVGDHPDVKPAEKRSVSEKIDEVLLLVRTLNVQSAKANKEVEEELTKRQIDRERLARMREIRARDMAAFRMQFPDARFVLKEGEPTGEVHSVSAQRDGDFVVNVWPIDRSGDARAYRALASELTFSVTPF